MRIRVEDIPVGGQEIEAGLETTWAREAVQEAMDAAPTTLSARFRLALADRKTDVAVRLVVHAEADGLCDRCGEEVHRGVDLDTDLVYQPEPTSVSEEEIELGEDDLDVGWYRDGHLSLPDILMEAVALELPSRVLCTDEEACEARTRAMLAAASEGGAGHPAFAALKNLKN
ncbi:MAG: DUF177 domain-containing protein [Alphaproteobacteria bacterium]|nr:DUF177 domain-containing protein [Alphaproteobacteria bacterium]